MIIMLNLDVGIFLENVLNLIVGQVATSVGTFTRS